MLVVFAAFKNEISGLLKLMNRKVSIRDKKCEIITGEIFNKEIIICITGIGKTNASMAAEKILAMNLSNPVFLIQGISGALTEKFKIGDVVIYKSIQNLEKIFFDNYLNIFNRNEIEIITEVNNLELEFLEDFEKNIYGNFNILKTSGAVVPEVVTHPGDKKNINESFGIETIDMESFYIAVIAKRQNIPVICIRAISDNLSEGVPEFFLDFGSSNFFKKFLFLFKIIFSGSKIKSACRILKNINTANKNLNVFIINTVLPSQGYK